MQLQEPVTPRESSAVSSPLTKPAPVAVTARMVVRSDESVALVLALEDSVSVRGEDVLPSELSQVSHQLRPVRLTFEMCLRNKAITHTSA